MAETVSQDILDNMGDLSTYIGGREYSTAVVAMNGETVVSNPYGTVSETLAPAGPHAAPGAFPQQQQGVVPQPVAPVQPSLPPVPQRTISDQQYQAAMAYAQRMEQAALQAAADRREAEDQAFLNSIAHLPKVEQDREVLIRYNQQLEQAYRGLNETVAQREAREEAEEQEQAKAFIGMRLAINAGLPWGDPDIQATIMSAEDRPKMERIVNVLARGGGRQTSGQIAGQLMAAPPTGNRAPRGQGGPREGSGDIAGLIKSRAYH
jgi:hypothetical protein